MHLLHLYMQNTSSTSDSNEGDGIYDRSKGHASNEDELSLLPHESEDARELGPSLDGNHNLLEEPDTIDDILDVLSRELEHLDQLKQKQSNQHVWAAGKIDFGGDRDFENLFGSKHSPDRGSQSSQRDGCGKFILNNYIKSTIQ